MKKIRTGLKAISWECIADRHQPSQPASCARDSLRIVVRVLLRARDFKFSFFDFELQKVPKPAARISRFHLDRRLPFFIFGAGYHQSFAGVKALDDAIKAEHRSFLASYKIPESAVLVAGKLKRADWQAELKRQNKAVALVESLCGKGHSLRLRLSSGHCMECSPQGVASWIRHQQDAFIYIAISRARNLTKIGISKLASERADSLNRDGYGGATDWFVLYRRKFKRAGSIEAQVHSRLKEYNVTFTYVRLGHGTEVTTRELFACSYAQAREVIEGFSQDALGDKWER